MQRKKIIYVAAASPGEAAADLCRLCLLECGDSLSDSLRVVVPSRHASELESLVQIPKNILLRYDAFAAPRLWARLMIFLGLSGENEVIVFSPPGRSRWLKLLALALRGRVSFSAGDGDCVPFSLAGVLRAGWRRRFAAHGPICLIGSASAGSLEKILADVRRRYPEAPVHGVLPASLAESLGGLDSQETVQRWGLKAYGRIAGRCFGRRRYQRIILPWTDEKPQVRWLEWWLPLWRIEIYNRNLGAFPGRHLGHLVRYCLWQFREALEHFGQFVRYCLWRFREEVELRRQRRERRRQAKVEFHRSLPVGIVGSASVLYLREILCDLRRRYPGVKFHAILPQSLEAPAQGMFDRVTLLRGGFVEDWLQARRFLAGAQQQVWIVPCTNEPYARMKLLAFLLPLSPRLIYNELADGFPARRLPTLYGHCLWRLRDHLSYQIVAGAAGGNWIARLGHLALYSGRLLAGAATLWQARLRSGRIPVNMNPVAEAGPRVDLLLLGRRLGGNEGRNGAGRDFQDHVWTIPSSSSNGSIRVARVPVNGSGNDLNEAIRASDAEFVCLLDPECRIAPHDWIERLLASFDDRTAQVGPELASLDGETVLRGLLLESRGALAWNFDNAVRWHRHPECLEVDALPRLCVVLRRRVFTETGYFAADSGTMEGWADGEFSKRLRALGWRSVCNRSVTATHPAVRLGLPAASQEVTEELRR